MTQQGRVECIILDGFHKGHHIVMSDIRQRISLPKPKAITIDDCCGGDVVGVDNDLRKDYELAFVAIDRKIALYTTDGSSKPIMQRGWIVGDRTWLETPLYMGIHDPRAVIDYTTIKELL